MNNYILLGMLSINLLAKFKYVSWQFLRMKETAETTTQK